MITIFFTFNIIIIIFTTTSLPINIVAYSTNTMAGLPVMLIIFIVIIRKAYISVVAITVTTINFYIIFML